MHSNMINALGPFQPFRNHKIFVKLNLPTFPVLVRRREKSQKYFDLLDKPGVSIIVDYSRNYTVVSRV